MIDIYVDGVFYKREKLATFDGSKIIRELLDKGYQIANVILKDNRLDIETKPLCAGCGEGVG